MSREIEDLGMNLEILKAFPSTAHLVDVRELRGREVFHELFPLLVKSKGTEFEELYDFLVAIADAESVMDYALYILEENYAQEYIQLASSMICDFGEGSFFVLESLFSSNFPEAEEFVSTAFFLKNTDDEKKHYLLSLLKESPVEEVRMELVECLECCNHYFREELLKDLANDPSSIVRERAKEILEG